MSNHQQKIPYVVPYAWAHIGAGNFTGTLQIKDLHKVHRHSTERACPVFSEIRHVFETPTNHQKPMNIREDEHEPLKMSIRQWAKELSVSPPTLSRWLKEHGFNTKRKDGFTVVELIRATYWRLRD